MSNVITVDMKVEK